jgi:hypothetical protein
MLQLNHDELDSGAPRMSINTMRILERIAILDAARISVVPDHQ